MNFTQSAMNLTIGVDIGGTHITAAVVDAASGKLFQDTYFREHVDASGTPGEIIAAWTKAIRASAGSTPLASVRIGISMPGPFDYSNGISLITGLHKFESLYGVNVRNLLAESIGTPAEHIAMENDAICYLAGERLAGPAQAGEYVAGITLGTGLGSAVFQNNRYSTGDLYCMPFRGSRAEEYLCSRWFVEEYRKRTGQLCTGVKELAQLAAQNPIAGSLFEEFGLTLAEVLTIKFQSTFPEMIVIGGNIANAWTLFYPSFINAIDSKDTKFAKAALGEQSALIGAVSFVPA